MKGLTPPSANKGIYTDLHSLQKLKTEKDGDAALRQVAREFESMMISMMLKNMRSANAVFEEDSLFNGGDTQFYRDMYDQQLSLTLSEGRGMGLADVLYRQMSGKYGDQVRQAPSTDISKGGEPAKELERPGRTLNSSVGNEPSGVFESAKQFIDATLPVVKQAASALGVNPVVLVAQAALETGWGKHMVRGPEGENSFNLFNIKADPSWGGEKVGVTTLEYYDGSPIKERAFFRQYQSLQESVQDYVGFLQGNPRYEKALAVAHDEKQYVQELQAAGYATDPNYTQKVISVFERLQASVGNSSQ